jgi:arsenite oxidase small subunit
LERREFVKKSLLGTVAFAGGFVFINDARAADLPVVAYKKALLTDANGKPIWFDTIAKDAAYIFNYPFAATPNFLLFLDLPVKPMQFTTIEGKSYDAPGGAGKDRNLVAYSAICPHQLSYPNKEFSVINYYDKKEQGCASGVQLIKCCAHNSIFDPKICGKKIDGPAENHMTMIVLEADEKEKKIYAVGVAGKSQYEEFFDIYKQDVRKDYGSSAKAKEELEKIPVIRMDKYSASLIRC